MGEEGEGIACLLLRLYCYVYSVASVVVVVSSIWTDDRSIHDGYNLLT